MECVNYSILSNGSKLIFAKNTRDDLVCLNMFLPVSIETEKDNRHIGSFVCSMLLKGTNKYSTAELAFKLESLGASIHYTREDDYINFSLVLSKNYIKETVDLFFHILKEPSFIESEIDKKKEEYYNAIDGRFDRIFNVAYDLLIENLYGKNNPYVWGILKDKKSVSDISRVDLINFHKRYFVSIGAVFSIIGNCEENIIKDLIEKWGQRPLFEKSGRCPHFPTDFSDLYIEDKDRDKSVIEIEKEFNQSYIMYGFLAPSVKDENYLSLKLINDYLGHGMTSVMFDLIREDLGLVYEISSFYPSRKHTSRWVIYMGLDNKNINKAIDAVDKKLSDIKNKGIKAIDLEKTKIKVKSDYFLDHQTKMRRSWYLGFWEILGLGYEFDKKYPNLINSKSLDDINRTFKQIISENKRILTIIHSKK